MSESVSNQDCQFALLTATADYVIAQAVFGSAVRNTEVTIDGANKSNGLQG